MDRPHTYSFIIKVPENTILHLRGWFYDFDNHPDDWEKHVRIDNISLICHQSNCMKYFSAQYIITNSGPPLKRAVITTEDDGTILSIEDTGGNLKEKHSVEFHNGIIIPGFVNCHCHLELSHMKGSIAQGTWLGRFY